MFSGIFAAIVLGDLVQGALVINLMVVESQRLNERGAAAFPEDMGRSPRGLGTKVMAFTFACAACWRTSLKASSTPLSGISSGYAGHARTLVSARGRLSLPRCGESCGRQAWSTGRLSYIAVTTITIMHPGQSIATPSEYSS